MDNLAALGATGSGAHAPALRRRGDQHGSGRRSLKNRAVLRGFADMSWSPCAEFGNGGAIPASCLSGPFLVSRFCCVPGPQPASPVSVTHNAKSARNGAAKASGEALLRKPIIGVAAF